MEEVRNFFSSVDVPKEYETYYNNRVSAFLYWLAEEHGAKVSDIVIQMNRGVGKILFAGYASELPTEDTLAYMGYEFLGEHDTKDFEKTIGKNKRLIEKIIAGEILIGYIKDFSRIVLTNLGTDAMRETSHYVH